MSNIKKLNNYDIKDNVAREDIATLNNQINTGDDSIASIVETLNNEINNEETGISTRVSALESNKADKATTLAGYGITDTYTKSEINDFEGELLWENVDATQPYVGQTVAFNKDISGYDKIEILFDTASPYKNYQYFDVIYSQNSTYDLAYTTYLTNIQIRKRSINFGSTTSITFGDGYEDDTLMNDIMVPVRIIGYKYIYRR